MENNISITDPKVKANIFVKYFKQIGNLSNVPLSIELEMERSCTEGHHMEINKSIVISELNSAIKSLKMKLPGSDMIHNIFFKHIPTRIHSDLLKMINKSWETSEVPDKWKESIAIPILKPNKDETKPESYRPITLLSCTGKLMEKIVQKRLEGFVESNNILSKSQCGFRRCLSTIDVLLRLENIIRTSFLN